MELAQPAPIVDEAYAKPALQSGSVVAEPAKITKPPEPDAATIVAAATTDYNKYAPKISKQEASNISVSVLKKNGFDFESEAAVIKGCVKKNLLRRWLPSIYDERDFVSYGEVVRFIFLRGNCLFIYGQKSDPKPLFVIEISEVRAEIENPKTPHTNSYTISPQHGNNMTGLDFVTVLLLDKALTSTNQLYQITFDASSDKSIAQKFVHKLQTNSKYFEKYDDIPKHS